MPLMDQVGAIVIGAGVVGLAVARALSQAGRETIVAEAQSAIGQGVSSRNSEVIHAGLYYATGSLKARLCVRGKQLLYGLCASHGVNHRNCGKLVVANTEAEAAALRRLQDRAIANGVPVQLLEARQAQALEPRLRCIAALLSPTTGIVDSHGLMLALQGDLEAAGGTVALASRVQSAVLGQAGRPHVLRMADGSEVAAPVLVNSASLHACSLARRFEGLDPTYVPREYFAKGNYYALAGRAPFSRLIYPAPADAWLGVHLTLDLGGQAKFGPDLEWLDTQQPGDIDYTVDPRRADGFYAEVRRYWPDLPDGALQPSYSGVRPRIHGPGDLAPDFRIDGPQLHGIPGLINLFGIESPGLTSALAIGEHVAALLGSTPR
jgi:L-2-hydroxyglutarate oxidase LhgO